MAVRPKISFIVPVYKVEKELDRCMASLSDQEGCSTEIILVDDGSPDDCPGMCDSYAASDERIRVIHQENRGLSGARNTGLLAACGEYVWFVDSDDYIAPDACRELADAMEKGEDIVTFGYYTVRPSGEVTKFTHRSLTDNAGVTSRDYIIRTIREGTFFVQSWVCLYRREFLLENDFFFKQGYLFEDLQMAPRLLPAAKTIVYVDKPLYYYVIREASIITSPTTAKAVQDTRDILTEWKERFDRITDRELQSWLYHELINAFIYCSHERGQSGWWIEGIDFPFAFSHAKTMRMRGRVIKYEGLSTACRCKRKKA